MASDHQKDGLVVLAVNAWDEDHNLLKEYAKQEKLNQRILLDGSDVHKRYGIPERRVPVVFFIDRAGRVVDLLSGAGGWETLDKTTKKLVAARG